MPRKTNRPSRPVPLHQRRSGVRQVRRNPQVDAHDRMLALEHKIRRQGLDLTPMESHELRLLYKELQVPPLHRIDTPTGRDKKALEWELQRHGRTNPGLRSFHEIGYYDDGLYRPLERLGVGQVDDSSAWLRAQQEASRLGHPVVLVGRGAPVTVAPRGSGMVNPSSSDYDWTSAEATRTLDALTDRQLSKRIDIIRGQIERAHPHGDPRVDAAVANLQAQEGAVIRARLRKGNPGNPPGDTADRISYISLPMIQEYLDIDGHFWVDLVKHPGSSFHLRRHDDGDLTAAVKGVDQVQQGAEVVVPEDQIQDVYHYALHHGTMEGWEPMSGGYASGEREYPPTWQSELDAPLENPNPIGGYYVVGVGMDVAGPQWHSEAFPTAEEAQAWIDGYGVTQSYKDTNYRVKSVADYWRDRGYVEGAGGLVRIKTGRRNPAANPRRYRLAVATTGSSFPNYYEYDSVQDLEDEFRKSQGPLTRYVDAYALVGSGWGATYRHLGHWGHGQPGVGLREANPAASPKQYRLAQAVLSGTARETHMPVEVAREIVERTPAGLRSEYSRYTANPDYRSQFTAFDAGKEFRTSGAYYETGVDNARVAKYGFHKWLNNQPKSVVKAKTRLMKEFLEGWAEGGSWMAHRRGNPADAAANLYQEFHGVPSEQEVVVTEEVHYHGNLAGLGDLVEIVIKTPSGYKAVLDFGKSGTLLCSSEDGKQLYLRGGDQSIDLDAIQMSGDEWLRDSMVLGTILNMTYRTAKKFDALKVLDYQHKLGEESGVRPELIYDVLNNQLSVAGGQYDVLGVGITN